MRNMIASDFSKKTTIQNMIESLDAGRITRTTKSMDSGILNHLNHAATVRGVTVDNDSDKPFSALLADNPDYKNLTSILGDRTIASVFLAVGVNPDAYFSAVTMDREEWSKKARIDADAYSVNVKAYNKVSTLSRFCAGIVGSDMEAVLKSFVASAIIAHQHMTVLPRNTITAFLGSVPMTEGLAEHLDKYRAKHMTGGAATQTSQCTLVLANLRAGRVVRNGKYKDYSLDLDSPIIESIAQRFGMESHLEKARKFCATVANDAETLLSQEA